MKTMILDIDNNTLTLDPEDVLRDLAGQYADGGMGTVDFTDAFYEIMQKATKHLAN